MLNFLKKYVNNKIELIKLQLTENVSNIVSVFIYAFFILLLALMFLLLLSFSIGLLIGECLNNVGLGLLIISFLYLIIFLIFLFCFKSMKKYIKRKLIEHQLNEKSND